MDTISSTILTVDGRDTRNGNGRRKVGSPKRHHRRCASRAAILEVAASEFAEKGYEGASLADIGGRLGVSAPLLLYHFGSKEDLWRAAMEVIFSRLSHVVEEAVDDGRILDGRRALETVLRRLVYFMAANPAFHRMVAQESHTKSQRLQWMAARYLRALFAQIESVYDRAVAEGSLKAERFDQVVFVLMGAASQYLDSSALAVMIYGKSVGGPEGLRDYADRILSICFEGLACSEAWSPAALGQDRSETLRAVVRG